MSQSDLFSVTDYDKKNECFSWNNPVYNVISLDRTCVTWTQVSTAILNQSEVPVHTLSTVINVSLRSLHVYGLRTVILHWRWCLSAVTRSMCWGVQVPSLLHSTSDKNCDIYSALTSKCFLLQLLSWRTHTSAVLHTLIQPIRNTVLNQTHSSVQKPRRTGHWGVKSHPLKVRSRFNSVPIQCSLYWFVSIYVFARVHTYVRCAVVVCSRINRK